MFRTTELIDAVASDYKKGDLHFEEDTQISELGRM